METREIMLGLAIKNNGEWNSIYSDLVNKNTDFDVENVLNGFTGDFITLLDQEYPETLNQIYKPPFVLFYKGNINLLKNTSKNCLVSGTRTPTREGEQFAQELFSENLKNRNLVVSLTKGINEIIINNCTNVIAVIACGFDQLDDYSKMLMDKVLANNGLVITEYPNNVPPDQQTHMSKVRIMVGLSTKTILLESNKHGSQPAIVSMTLFNGHDLFVAPTSPANKNSINNQLIKKGAFPILDRETLEYDLDEKH